MKTLWILLLALLSGFASAQVLPANSAAVSTAQPRLDKVCEWESAPHFRNTHTVGGVAGVTQGLGITYRRWFTQNGFQVSLLPMISVEENYQSLFLSVAGSYLHALWESPLYDFFYQPSRNLVYSYVGLHYVMDRLKDENSDGWGNYANDLTQSATLGGGLGLQTNMGAVQLSLGIGYALSLHDTRNWETPSEWEDWGYLEDQTSFALHPTLDATLGYTFGW